MNYTDTFTRTELRQAISYIIYKKMKRTETQEDKELITAFKKALDERSHNE